MAKVEMPALKKKTREMLYTCRHLQTRETGKFYSRAPRKLVEVIKLKKKALAIVIPSIFLLLGVLYLSTLLSPPQAVANLTLQVNPVITMTLDDDNTVIDIKGKNEDGVEIITISDLQGKKLDEALAEITSILYEQGYLLPEGTVAMMVHGPDNADQDKLSAISNLAKETVQENLIRLNIIVQVESFVLSEELFAYLDELGLTPADYVDLLKANLTEDEIKEVIRSLEQAENDTEALLYLKFKLKIKSGERELFAEFKQKQFGNLAKVMIKQKGQKHIQLKDSDAYEYLLPILEELDLGASLDKNEVVDRVLAAFGWEGSYQEFKIEIKFADKSFMDFKCKAKGEEAQRERERDREKEREQDQERETALPYRKFELEIESNKRKLKAEIEQEDGEISAKMESSRDGKKTELKGSAALEYLLPILKKLDLNASMDKQEVMDRVVTAFGWEGFYEEFEIKVKFNNGSNLDFKWKCDYDDDD